MWILYNPKEDLQEAITECEGERNPNANTCMKLAAFYTIMDHLYGGASSIPSYSYAAPPEAQIGYQSETEFAEATKNMTKDEMMPILDELMETIEMIHPRLYDSVMKNFHKKY